MMRKIETKRLIIEAPSSDAALRLLRELLGDGEIWIKADELVVRATSQEPANARKQ